MSEIYVGRPLIAMQKQGTTLPGGSTPIQILGNLVNLFGNITDGVPITVNLKDSSGNLVPNGPITQLGNSFNAEIIDVTPISVNTVPQGNITNWQNINIDVDDKNGVPITPVITKVGNTLNLDIAGTTPIQVNTVPQGTIDNWDTVNIDVDDKNGVPITPVITKVGNTLNLDIAGQTPLQINATPAGAIDNWDTIFIDVDDKNGNPVTPTISIVGNNINLDIAGNTGVQVNTGGQIGTIPNWDLIDIRLRDQLNNPIVPTSVTFSGSVITINENISSPGSGIAFQIAQGTQYTSYANFDEGWRMQNGWFDYVPPSAPLKRAYLDYTQGANSFYVLGEALSVGGVANTTRFVDVNGLQTFTGGTNRDKVLIDKLTGLMMYRVYDQGDATWATALNNADAFSLTVNLPGVGNTLFNDWYLISAAEAMAFFGNNRQRNWTDPVTSILISAWANGYNHTATTYVEITTQATSYRTHAASGGGMYSNFKTNSYPQIFIRKCRNLIS